MNINPNVGLSLIQPDSSGHCSLSSGQQRLPLLFGQDQRTGCKITISSGQLCTSIRKYILFALEGSTFLVSGLQVYVGALGNATTVQNTLDSTGYVPGFVPVIAQDVTSSEQVDGATIDNSCDNMVVGAHFKVLYSEVGELSNSQSVITGIHYTYETIKSLKYPSFLSTSTGYSIEIVSSVTYVDVSDPSKAVYAQLQPITIDLGDDFFFPFTNHAAHSHEYNVTLSLGSVFVLCIFYFM